MPPSQPCSQALGALASRVDSFPPGMLCAPASPPAALLRLVPQALELEPAAALAATPGWPPVALGLLRAAARAQAAPPPTPPLAMSPAGHEWARSSELGHLPCVTPPTGPVGLALTLSPHALPYPGQDPRLVLRLLERCPSWGGAQGVLGEALHHLAGLPPSLPSSPPPPPSPAQPWMAFTVPSPHIVCPPLIAHCC